MFNTTYKGFHYTFIMCSFKYCSKSKFKTSKKRKGITKLIKKVVKEST